MNQWTPIEISLPAEGEVVMTKIDDAQGMRNEQPLMRRGNLWFFEDESMYVYYRPTHTRQFTEEEKSARAVSRRAALLKRRAEIDSELAERNDAT